MKNPNLNKTLFTAFVILISNSFLEVLQGQTKHSVTINGLTFNPASLTIELGDEVEWTNKTSVGHNVNGTTATFSGNPESFGNSVSSTDWTFKFKFSKAGTYNYQCNPHAGAGMKGKIIVNAGGTSDIEEHYTSRLKIYPNRVTDYIYLQSEEHLNSPIKISILDLAGKKVKEEIINGQANIIDARNLKEGYYILQYSYDKSIRNFSFIKK